ATWGRSRRGSRRHRRSRIRLASPFRVRVMDAELFTFLRGRNHKAEGFVTWRGGSMPLRFRCYLDLEQPPAAFVTNVRAVVVGEASVLVLDRRHVLPRGRLELGETLDEALRRELLEETGWCIEPTRQLGFIHFHHLADKPADYALPYPDFLQVVYLARAV